MLKKTFYTTILVLLFFIALGSINKSQAAASLYLSASSTRVYPGNSVTVYVKVNTGGAATNAYSASVGFPSALRPTSISKGGSICSLFTQEPTFSTGSASFNCGLPSPGYNGGGGTIGSVTVRAISKGTHTISVTGGQVLANDGVGTNILGSTGSVTISVVDPPPPPVGTPTITSSTGEEAKWNRVTDVTFTWTKPSNATGFSYSLSKDQNANPARSNQGDGLTKAYEELEDGIYYFKVMATDGSRWGNPATFTLRIDNTPPHDIDIVPEPDKDPIDKPPMISFNAIDDTSGIDHYEIKIDEGEFKTVESPYQFEEITSGEHTITIQAYDKAGNMTEKTITINIAQIEAPTIIIPKKNTYFRVGDDIYIEGLALPNAILYIYLNDELIGEVTADENGKFSMTYKKLLSPGKYEIYARVKDTSGIIGAYSEKVPIRVDSYAIKIGGIVIPGIFFLVCMSVFFLVLILLLIFLYRKYKKKKGHSKEETAKLEKSIDSKLDKLEDDLSKNITKVLWRRQPVDKALKYDINNEIEREIKETEGEIDSELYRLSGTKKKKRSRAGIFTKIKSIPGKIKKRLRKKAK